jgi:hypothetical protein
MRRWHLFIAMAILTCGLSAIQFYLHLSHTIPYMAWYVPWCWLAVPVLMTFMAYSVYRHDLFALRLSRKRQGLCDHCGYDLRASAGRCPECGKGPTKMETKA